MEKRTNMPPRDLGLGDSGILLGWYSYSNGSLSAKEREKKFKDLLGFARF